MRPCWGPGSSPLRSTPGRSRTCIKVGLRPTAGAVRSDVIHKREPAVGLEATSTALRGRCPARRASPALSSSQCWCRANSTEVQSPGPLPRAWPEIQSQRRDSNPHAPLYKRGARPIELHWHCRCRVDSRLRSGIATVTGSHAATTPYPLSQSVLDLLSPILEVAARLKPVDLQVVVAEQ